MLLSSVHFLSFFWYIRSFLDCRFTDWEAFLYIWFYRLRSLNPANVTMASARTGEFLDIQPSSSSPQPPNCMAASHIDLVAQPSNHPAVQLSSHSAAQPSSRPAAVSMQSLGSPAVKPYSPQPSNRPAIQPPSHPVDHHSNRSVIQQLCLSVYLAFQSPDPPAAKLWSRPFLHHPGFQPPNHPAAQPFSCQAI